MSVLIDVDENDSRNILQAYGFAEAVHESQSRKNLHGGKAPYIVHPANVYASVTKWVPKNTLGDNLRIAALLHDTVEDYDKISDPVLARKYVSSQIRGWLGEQVLEIVLSVTNPLPDKTKNPMDSYREHLHHLSIYSPLGLVIKVADLKDNAGSLSFDGIDLDTLSRKQYLRIFRLINKYYEVIGDVVDGVALHEQFYRARSIDFDALFAEAQAILNHLKDLVEIDLPRVQAMQDAK